tara:strand:- start:921 stop:1955 length:1035 start_codon:yes stop_codon:yes gene_type:complete
MTFPKEKESTTSGSPLDPAASSSGRRITRLSEIPYSHNPVMVTEITQLFSKVPPGVIVDATLGGGGHAYAILKSRPDLKLIGIDRDQTALSVSKKRLVQFEGRTSFIHDRFDNLGAILEMLGVEKIAGALFDLGVSSYQIDNPDRGFSFRKDGPLDMRMDSTQGRTAQDLVNEESEIEIARILKQYGDERFHRRISKAIIAARPILTTGELADVVLAAMPAHSKRSVGHPARRTFQAIRIAVNQELFVLRPAIAQTIQFLQLGGRCGILSYHSGEDRIIKQMLREHAGLKRQNSRYVPEIDEEFPITLLSRKGLQPSEKEIENNPRSSSARLRTFEKLLEISHG